MSLQLNPVGGIIQAVGQVADDLFTSDDKRNKTDIDSMKVGLDAARVDADLIKGQQAINTEEAKSASVFVAGWRPAIGWVGVVALAYQFLLYPLLTWAWVWMQAGKWVPMSVTPPPMLNTDALMVLLTGILGIATTRTFEKVRGVTARKAE
mgnify:FL=1